MTKQQCGMTKPRCKFRNRCFSYCLWKYTKRSLVDFICSILHTLKLAYKINYIFRLSEINLRLSNLLNEKRYASTMLGDLTRSYSEYRIRPFNAVVEVYYRF